MCVDKEMTENLHSVQRAEEGEYSVCIDEPDLSDVESRSWNYYFMNTLLPEDRNKIRSRMDELLRRKGNTIFEGLRLHICADRSSIM